MTDSSAAGRQRIALAERKMAELDFEATGQLPTPYAPRRRTKNPPVIRPALAWLMSIPMEQAKRERQRKAERRSQPYAQSHGYTLSGDWDVAVIIRSNRRQRIRDWGYTIVFIALIFLLASVLGK